MKIVFMGTSEFAVPSLIKLMECNYSVVGVVTQPDRPKGRGKKVLPPPVKEIAKKHNLKIYQPESIKDSYSINDILSLEPDLIVVVSYGQIIPKEILNYPSYGCINVHASLLPEYRGAAPIQRAIMDGKTITGVTTMLMEEGLDTGDIIMQSSVKIDMNINYGNLEKVLAQEGAELLIKTIKAAKNGTMPCQKQDNNLATYASMITADDEKIDWNDSAIFIHNKIRALSPSPGAYTFINGIKVKVFATKIEDETKTGTAGMIININKEGFLVQTGKGIILVTEVQREGRKKMSARDFMQGFPMQEGDLITS